MRLANNIKIPGTLAIDALHFNTILRYEKMVVLNLLSPK
jgi:hypothetical protein